MKYIISAIDSPYGGPISEPDIVEHDPENAIIAWMRLGEKYPTCTSLQPDNAKSGLDLLKWASMNFEKLEVWMKEHKCPYKPEWMKEQIERQLKRKKCSMQWDYDELCPFCMG